MLSRDVGLSAGRWMMTETEVWWSGTRRDDRALEGTVGFALENASGVRAVRV